MKRIKLLVSVSLAVAALFLSGTPARPQWMAQAQAEGDKLRAEIGKPIIAAQDLMKGQKYKEALARLHDADAIADKTPYEIFTIERVRGAIAVSMGDNEQAEKSFDAVLSSGRLPAPDQLKIIEALAGSFYRAKEYGKAATWAARYLKEGGSNPQIRTLQAQSYFLAGDFSAAAKAISASIQADEHEGKAPSEDVLQLLGNCYVRMNDNSGYTSVLETLLAHYPKKEYFLDLLARVQRKPGFADRLALDVDRLNWEYNNLSVASDYMELAQLALQAGFSAEAKKVVDQGFARNVLGSGADADRHKRLRDLVYKNAADDDKELAHVDMQALSSKDGNAQVNTGFALVAKGIYDKGITLMEQGVRKGDVKRVEDAKLHLGIAYFQAGQKAKAIQMFKTVQGKDGTADLARMWILRVNSAG